MTDKDFTRLDPFVPESDGRIGRGNTTASHDRVSTSDTVESQASSSARGVSGRSRSRRGGARTRSEAHPSTSLSNKKSSSWFSQFMVLILVVGLAGLSFFFIQQSKQLDQLQSRFDELEAKIVSTDESLNQSGSVLGVKLGAQQATLDKHWSEIKKLWGVANDRNRKAIDEQKETLEAQAKTIKALEASSAARKKEVAGLKASLDKASKSLETVINSSLAAKLEVNDLNDRSQSVIGQMNEMEKSLEKLGQNLMKRVSTNEEAIAAIDAYRLQVNRDIQQIKQQIQNISGSPRP